MLTAVLSPAGQINLWQKVNLNSLNRWWSHISNVSDSSGKSHLFDIVACKREADIGTSLNQVVHYDLDYRGGV